MHHLPLLDQFRCGLLGGLVAVVCVAGCGPAPDRSGPLATPVYSTKDGSLEQLVSDRDGDGKIDTRAYMQGTHLVRIEIDRNGDERPDRREYYEDAPAGVTVPGSPDGRAMITRAEETGGPGPEITRREFYTRGVIERVEEDTDLDGRVDKWETYEAGVLARVDLDLQGKGFADRRLIYGAGGNVIRIEADPDGDGTFVVIGDGGTGKEDVHPSPPQRKGRRSP